MKRRHATDPDLAAGIFTHAERALLSRLRNAISQCRQFYITTEQFEGRIAGVSLETWESFQTRVGPDTQLHAELSCLLAYLDVNYSTNLRQMLRLYHLASCTGERNANHGVESYLCFLLPGFLAIVYRKHRDSILLGQLLDMCPMQFNIFNDYCAVIAALWDEDRDAVLRCASTTVERVDNLSHVLAQVCRLVPDEMVWTTYEGDLNHAMQTGDATIAATARQLWARLQSFRAGFELTPALG